MSYPHDTAFSIKATNINSFEIIFISSAESEERMYYYMVSSAKVESKRYFKSFQFGGNSTSREGVFYISNFSKKSSPPPFDLICEINVPFFKRGHFFKIINVVESYPSVKSFLTVEILHGSSPDTGPRLIYDSLELKNNQLQILPITW